MAGSVCVYVCVPALWAWPCAEYWGHNTRVDRLLLRGALDLAQCSAPELHGPRAVFLVPHEVRETMFINIYSTWTLPHIQACDQWVHPGKQGGDPLGYV